MGLALNQQDYRGFCSFGLGSSAGCDEMVVDSLGQERIDF